MTTIIQDSFVGTAGGTPVAPLYRGNVHVQNSQGLVGPNDHVSETGDKWYEGNTNSYLRLNGSGAATEPHNEGTSDAWCATPLNLVDYFVEVDVNIGANDDVGFVNLYFKIKTQPNPAYGAENSDYGRVTWTPVNGASNEQIDIGDEGNLFTGSGNYNVAGGTFGDHTLRVECRGDVATVFVDGVSKISRTMTGSWRANVQTWVGLGLRQFTSDGLAPGITIKEFRAGTLGNLFWAGHDGTREIE